MPAKANTIRIYIGKSVSVIYIYLIWFLKINIYILQCPGKHAISNAKTHTKWSSPNLLLMPDPEVSSKVAELTKLVNLLLRAAFPPMSLSAEFSSNTSDNTPSTIKELWITLEASFKDSGASHLEAMMENSKCKESPEETWSLYIPIHGISFNTHFWRFIVYFKAWLLKKMDLRINKITAVKA